MSIHGRLLFQGKTEIPCVSAARFFGEIQAEPAKSGDFPKNEARPCGGLKSRELPLPQKIITVRKLIF